MRAFLEVDPPVEAYRVPTPTLEDVDNHPDRDFIWAVILAMRAEVVASRTVPPAYHRRPIFGA